MNSRARFENDIYNLGEMRGRLTQITHKILYEFLKDPCYRLFLNWSHSAVSIGANPTSATNPHWSISAPLEKSPTMP